jgi:hypothetical protein
MYKGRMSDGRTPTFAQTDLGVAHEVKLPSNTRMLLSVNIQNLFDSKTATNRFRTMLASGYAIDIDEETFYRGVNTEALIQQDGIPLDPRFLMDSWFQNRRAIRLSARILF